MGDIVRVCKIQGLGREDIHATVCGEKAGVNARVDDCLFLLTHIQSGLMYRDGCPEIRSVVSL